MVRRPRTRWAYRYVHRLVDHCADDRPATAHRANALVRLANDVHDHGCARRARRVRMVWVYRNRDEIALTEVEKAYLNEDAKVEEHVNDLSFAEWGNLFRLRNTWGMIFGFMGVIYMVWL